MSDINFNKSRYTHRDYDSVKNELISLIPSLTQEWTSTEDSDPGIVLIKMMSMICDNLSFNTDKMALETYISTVSQRKNCAKILRLLGYKMHWYRSSSITCYVRLSEDSSTTSMFITPFTDKFISGNITYSVLPKEYRDYSPYQITSGDINSNFSVYVAEGLFNQFNFTDRDIIDYRVYLPVNNISECANHLYLYDNTNGQFYKYIDNIDSNSDMLHYFSFDVDEYDRCYIEFRNDWKDAYGTSANSSFSFTLRYLVTNGSRGNISANTLVYSGSNSSNLIVSHYGSVLQVNDPSDNSDNTEGKDPDTVDEARKDSYLYVHTHDTLVTSYDFEKAAKRANGVDASKLVDNQVVNNYYNFVLTNEAPTGTNLINCNNAKKMKRELFYREYVGDPEEVPPVTDVGDFEPYKVILYIGYDDFNLYKNQCYSSSGQSSGVVSTIEDDELDATYYANVKNVRFKNYGDPAVGDIQTLGYYPYYPSDDIQNEVANILEQCKIMNVEVSFGVTKLFPFKVDGTVYVNNILLPEEIMSLVANINDTLSLRFSSENLNYGEKVKLLDVVKTISDCDNRINYFDAGTQCIVYSDDCRAGQYIDTGVMIIKMFDDFDLTSFCKYNGLANSFNLAKECLKFKIYNSDANEVSFTIEAKAINGQTRNYTFEVLPQSSIIINSDTVDSKKADPTAIDPNPDMTTVTVMNLDYVKKLNDAVLNKPIEGTNVHPLSFLRFE